MMRTLWILAAVMLCAGCGPKQPASAVAGAATGAKASTEASDPAAIRKAASERRQRKWQAVRLAHVQDSILNAKIGRTIAALRSAELDEDVELLSVTRDNAIIRVVLAITRKPAQIWTELVTEDGNHILTNAIDLDRDTHRNTSARAFVDCLHKAGIELFVTPRGEASSAQVAAVGQYAQRVVTVCHKGADDPACQRAKVTQFPTVLVKGVANPGLKPRRWLETRSGCK